MSRLGAAFYAFALILLPVLAFVGLVAFLRRIGAASSDVIMESADPLLRHDAGQRSKRGTLNRLSSRTRHG